MPLWDSCLPPTKNLFVSVTSVSLTAASILTSKKDFLSATLRRFSWKHSNKSKTSALINRSLKEIWEKARKHLLAMFHPEALQRITACWRSSSWRKMFDFIFVDKF